MPRKRPRDRRRTDHLKAHGRRSGPVRRIRVEIHLPKANLPRDRDKIDRLRDTAAELLGSFGFVPDPRRSISEVFASWHWREWFRAKSPAATREGKKIYDEVKETARREYIDKAGAEAFGTRAKAASELLKSLEGIDQAIVRLGDTIIAKAKIDGANRLVIETLSPQMSRKLERSPMIGRDPVAFIRFLEGGHGRTRRGLPGPDAGPPEVRDV